MKYAFVDRHREQHAVRRMCKILDVSASGYYAWRKRPPSRRALRHQRLTVKIRGFFAQSNETYGAVRILHDLREDGERLGKNTVALLMRKDGLMPKPVRRFRVTTDSRKTIASPNLLEQDFEASKPNERWSSDITAIATREGWLYLCAILDLYSRAVVGWSMSERMKGELVTDALNMAILRRAPEGPLLVHSDQGSQFTSDHYQRLLKNNGMTSSMSRKGCCWDNAVSESFFASLKTERTHHEDYRTRTQAKLRVFDYIEGFYNRRRRHSKLGYKSPMNYELQTQ